MKEYFKITTFFIVLILCLLMIGNKSSAQTSENVINNIYRIDTVLSQMSRKYENVGKDSNFYTYSHGHSSYFKKILGLKIRYGRGELYTEAHILEDKLFFVRNESIRIKKNRNHHLIEIYYYFDNNLVKFERRSFWTDKNGENLIKDDNIKVYIESKKIIKVDSEKHNSYKFNKKELERVLNYSEKRLQEIKEVIEYKKSKTANSGYKLHAG